MVKMTSGTLPTSDAGVAARAMVTVARDIKLSHSVFALPWALLSAFLAAGSSPAWGRFAGQVGLIVVCMVSARTVAMAMNRVLDAKLDAINPRTAGRAIPAGRISVRQYLFVTIVFAVLFFLSTAGFGWAFGNWWPARLSVFVLAFLCAYPLLKRFTSLCHYYLGAALALAPVCAWVAVAGTVELTPFLIAGAVLFWTAGFDVIYACQDYASDVATGVFSVPARMGVGPALWVARASHVLSVGFMISLGRGVPAFGTIYFVGVTLAAGLLVVEHWLVRADDLSKVGLAFFTINGVISLVVGTLGVVDIFV